MCSLRLDRSSQDIEDLLNLEVEHELWVPEVRGLHLWSLIRYQVLSSVISRWLDQSNPISKSYRRRTRRDLVRYMRGLSLLDVKRGYQAHDALFIVSDLGRIPLNKGFSYDRLHDHYFQLFDNPLVLAGTFTPETPLPDYKFEHNIYPMTVLNIFARIRPSALSSNEQRIVSQFVQKVTMVYEVASLEEQLNAFINQILVRYKNVRQFFERYLVPRIGGRGVAIIENACYMGELGVITQLLHHHGFKVIEAQHGLLSSHHPAYQFATSILDDGSHPVRSYLPDAFLTFGEYWASKTHLPCELFTIGNAQLAGALRTISTDQQSTKKQILIVSGDNRALDLTIRLAEALLDYQIIFKLHPMEFEKYDAYRACLNYPNVTVKTQANIYELIHESEIVVGHSSTVLVEATAFANKRIFYFEPTAIPPEVGSRFESPEHLIELIHNPSTGYPSNPAIKFWELDVKSQITDFAKHFLKEDQQNAPK